MNLLSTSAAQGHVIDLLRSDPRHLSGSAALRPQAAATAEAGFGQIFFDALSSVNDKQLQTMDLTEAMITDPDSVDIHDITVAIAEANLALSMTKAIMDKAIRAYQEIINVR